jgi:hypothetical protein
MRFHRDEVAQFLGNTLTAPPLETTQQAKWITK